MAGRLKINASDLLGKLHAAALDKVNQEFKSKLGKIKQLFKGRTGKAENQIIENTAFKEKDGKIDIPNGPAKIRVIATGTNAKAVARDMMKTYMKWWAGIEDFNVDDYEDLAGEENSGVSQTKEKTVLGKFKSAIGLAYNLTISYDLTVDTGKPQDLSEINNDNKKSSDSSPNDSDVINLHDSIQIKFPHNKATVWESEHPFEILFNKENKTMISETKTNRFVKQVAKQKNVDAQRTLEEIIREKVEKRVKDVLDEEKAKK